MKILIDIGHPGHVHLFKETYRILKDKGFKVSVITKDIPVAKSLLEYYNIHYINIGSKKDSVFSKILIQFLFNLKTLFHIIKNKIDIGIGSSFTIAQISILTRMKSLNFDDDDDEVEPFFVKYAHPFSNIVLSPSSITRKTTKNIPYKGTHELAYLHPKRFTPDINVIKRIGLKENEPYFVLRFVALKGHHDEGHKGINLDQKRELINYLKDFGKIFITSEKPIEDEFEEYRLPVPPEEIHSLLYYAKMFLGDSQTMTSEAAILGTPALKCNTFAGKLSVPNELEEKYALCYSYQPVDFDKFLAKAKELLEDPNLEDIWQKRKDKFLSEKIDVTAFMVWFIENYPNSAIIMKENPDYQNKFK